MGLRIKQLIHLLDLRPAVHSATVTVLVRFRSKTAWQTEGIEPQLASRALRLTAKRVVVKYAEEVLHEQRLVDYLIAIGPPSA